LFGCSDDRNYIRGVETVIDTILSVSNTITTTVNIFTPSLNNNITTDWLRINNNGSSSGKVALYGSLCVNAIYNGHSGLAVGYWDENVGEGNIKASNNISCAGSLTATGVNTLKDKFHY
jgi:hypothetical protein